MRRRTLVILSVALAAGVVAGSVSICPPVVAQMEEAVRSARHPQAPPVLAFVPAASPSALPQAADVPSWVPPAPGGYTFWKIVNTRVTAYDPSPVSCGVYADGRTSVGDNAWHLDGVAVDPRAVPYRTLVFLPEAGWREADDTGAAMRRSWEERGEIHLDLRMTYPYEARQWGIRYAEVALFRPIP